MSIKWTDEKSAVNLCGDCINQKCNGSCFDKSNTNHMKNREAHLTNEVKLVESGILKLERRKEKLLLEMENINTPSLFNQ